MNPEAGQLHNGIDIGHHIAELFGGLWHVRHTPWSIVTSKSPAA